MSSHQIGTKGFSGQLHLSGNPGAKPAGMLSNRCDCPDRLLSGSGGKMIGSTVEW